MTVPHTLPSKKDVTLMLLQTSDVFIHLDPRKDNVQVPPHLKHQPHLILQVGLNMPVPIPDLDVTDDGITCTLSFSHSPFWCKLPWRSIYALVSEDRRGMVWPDDVPAEVAVKFVKETSEPQEQPAAAAPESAAEEAPVKSRGKRKTPKGQAASARTRKQSVPQPQPLPVAAPAVEEPESSPEPAAAAEQNSSKRTKRELPPYLRVVK